uniref:Uncharacterized protein LOC102809361 n=1 Tax=Saccoglossus kowalevskii TaxID=10224 RepID=A0ABM0MWP5_SACKO|nr:PREDICTED: uncharacterized protein LOC102809361 [Saccoglossus kowalevskii]
MEILHSGNTTTVLFDEWANRSFVTQGFANKLRANVHSSEVLNLKAFSNPRTGYKTIPRTTLNLHKRDGTTTPIDLLYVNEISDDLTNNVTADILQLPYLRELELAHPISSEPTITIDILIVVDKYWDFVGDHIICGPGPTAVSSPFGYLLSGPTPTGEARSSQVQTFHITALPSTQDQLEANVTSYWDLEAIGIRDAITASNELTNNQEQYKQYIENCLSQQDGRFIAKLPWKANHNPLPTNYKSTKKRTRNMIHKLPCDIVSIYDKVISDQLNHGFIEEVTNDNISVGHYLPHRSVKRNSATTPIHVVYDCSAATGNEQPSLNDCLIIGPPLLNNLTSILLRVRSNPIALTADIEKAFLQIRTRSPFILNAAIKTLTDDNIEISAACNLQQNIYLDDVITGCNSSDDAAQFYKESTDLLATRHFNLRSWSTNDPTLRDAITSSHRASSTTHVNILGLNWNSKTDQLNVKSLEPPNFGPLTSKRDVVGYAASLYDSLGTSTRKRQIIDPTIMEIKP